MSFDTETDINDLRNDLRYLNDQVTKLIAQVIAQGEAVVEMGRLLADHDHKQYGHE